MMHHFHQNNHQNQSICTSKSYYMDRLGNMSSTLSSSSSSGSGSASGGGGGAMAPPRKQILSLKPKNSYIQQQQEIKDPAAGLVPVVKLALKKDKKAEKNVVTQLTYRKPNSVTSSGGSTSSASTTSSSSSDYHMMMSMMMNGAAFHPDTMMDDNVFSSLLHSAYGYNPHDMLHSHPIWSQGNSIPNQMMMSSPDAMNNYFIEKENQFLVQ